jgi:hypothetical protein
MSFGMETQLSLSLSLSLSHIKNDSFQVDLIKAFYVSRLDKNLELLNVILTYRFFMGQKRTQLCQFHENPKLARFL